MSNSEMTQSTSRIGEKEEKEEADREMGREDGMQSTHTKVFDAG